jgi:hypothetical protein
MLIIKTQITSNDKHKIKAKKILIKGNERYQITDNDIFRVFLR